MEYVGLSKKTCIQFIEKGLPIVFINGRWHAHAKSIIAFFKQETRRTGRELPTKTITADKT